MSFATDQFYFKTAEEMAQVFGELPEALRRTVAIADALQCANRAVRESVPGVQGAGRADADSYFEERGARRICGRVFRTWSGCAKRARLRIRWRNMRRRLTNEIKMIKQMRYAGYFLIVWDFIHYARAQEIPVGPGRGSAAGSLVSYALRITDVDPLQYDLLFERFLNPERVSMPDIDIDFCMRRRGEVIEYVTREIWPRKRGADHHVRDHGGKGGAQGRGPRDGYALRRRGSTGQNGAQPAQYRARRCVEAVAAARSRR